MGRKAIDLNGRRFGKLTVLQREPNEPKKHARWLCACDCGKRVVVQSHCLISGSQQSCGCLLVELHQKHGKAGSRLYNIWNCMKQRCGNPNNHNFKEYGGRGIAVCDEWKDSFEAFYEWAMENGYDPDAVRGKCTLDRVDVNGNYEPSNCRWTDMKIQANNRRKGETHGIKDQRSGASCADNLQL